MRPRTASSWCTATPSRPSQARAALRRPAPASSGLSLRQAPAVACSAPPDRKGLRLSESLESALLDRLREVLRNDSATEGELRTLGEQANAWARVLLGQIHGSERRLQRLNGDPASPLADIAAELRLLDALRAETIKLSSLTGELERRSRELRAEWLVRQTSDPVRGTDG